MDKRLYWLWMQLALQPGNPHAGLLLKAFQTPAAVFQADEKTLAQQGISGSLLKRLCDKSMDEAGKLLEACRRRQVWLLTPDDACFPELLRGIFAPPLVLYGQGRLPDEVPAGMGEPMMGMVGTRKCSRYGLYAASSLAAGLAAGGMTVVSGGACGIDGACHQAAVDAGGRTIVVQACGLDVDYPRENAPLRETVLAHNGTILTEFPFGTLPLRHQFPVRNRLISGMSLGVCVVEAGSRSGALITASHAREQGRDVFAVPGQIGSAQSAGTNRLIKQGARLVCDACEMMEEYTPHLRGMLDFEAARQAQDAQGWPQKGDAARIAGQTKTAVHKAENPVQDSRNRQEESTAVCPEGVSNEAKKLYALLQSEPQPADMLAEQAGLSASHTLAALTELELEGCALQLQGQRYKRL